MSQKLEARTRFMVTSALRPAGDVLQMAEPGTKRAQLKRMDYGAFQMPVVD
jgi:hypothetical protein